MAYPGIGRFLTAVFLLSLALQTLEGQSLRSASWSGVLQETEGKPLSGAVIELREASSGLQFKAITNRQGGFSFSDLPSGRYRVSVHSGAVGANGRGFISLKAGETLKADLEISEDGQLTVRNVPAIAGLLNANGTSQTNETATGGEKLTGKQVSKLPLNGRDFGQLLLLAAGTMTDANGAANFTQQYAVNGQRGVTAVFAMDGIDITDPELGGATFDNFNVDAIREIQSSSGVMPAEIGEGAASYTNVITKSGTSAVHGDVFEFLRSSVNPGRLPHFERNEFGLTNGGPVTLPGLYDGKGRTYYFGEYQGFRQILGTTQVLSVPTLSERMGLDTTAFPGDTLIVPVSPLVVPVLTHYPLPNDLEGPYGARTFATSTAVTTNSDQFSLRIDHKISDKAHLLARFTFDNVTGPTTNPSQLAIDPSFAIRFFDHERNVGLKYTRTISPNLVSESTLGFIRATPVFPSINTTQPALLFGDGLYEPFNSAGGTETGSYGNLFQLRESLSYLRGRHAFKMGVETRFNRDTTIFGTTPNGQYTFGGGTAYSPVEIRSASGQHDIHVGDPLPDSLTGLLTATPYSYTASIAYPLFPQGSHIGESAIHRDAYNFYFQDAWKLTDGLTLNYGLRYEVDTPIRERHHLTSGPVFLGPDGRPAPVWETGVMEEAVFYPQPPYRYSTDWGGWAPRVNLDWRAMKQTVFHAGGAITTLLTNLYQDNFLTGGFPMVVSPYITTTPGFPIPFVNGPLPIHLPGLFTAQGAPLFASSNPMTVPPNTVMDIQRFEEDVAAQAPGSGIHPVTLFSISRNFQNGYIATYTAGLEHHFGDVTRSEERRVGKECRS